MNRAGQPTADSRAGVLGAIVEALGLTLHGARRVRMEASGGGFVTGHEVQLADDSGVVRTETLYLDSGEHTGAEVLRLQDEHGETISAWLYPNDPELPTLPAAVFPDAAAVLLQRLGLDSTGLQLAVLAYRPCKRAVVRMTTDTGSVFLKVLRPAAAEPLHALHASWLAACIPVPQSLAWAPEGLVALAPLPGREAVGRVEQLGEQFLDNLDELIARIAAVPSAGPGRASLASRADWYRRRVSELSPDLTERVGGLTARVTEALHAAGGPLAGVTVHGDLHLGQVFVDPDEPNCIRGLLDIDTAGHGDPADDAAAMWAHLAVTALQRGAQGDPDARRAAAALAARMRERWPRRTDPAFAARAGAISAVHLLGHTLSGAVAPLQAIGLAEASLTEENPLISA